MLHICKTEQRECSRHRYSARPHRSTIVRLVESCGKRAAGRGVRKDDGQDAFGSRKEGGCEHREPGSWQSWRHEERLLVPGRTAVMSDIEPGKVSERDGSCHPSRRGIQKAHP